MPRTPLPCQRFDDILDGYFPLGISVAQCLERNGFATALFVLTHAPILHLDDRPDTAPVPLRLGGQTSGLIRRLMVRATTGRSPQGQGEWLWHDGVSDRPLTARTRLAEPAFVRGIGLRHAPEADAPLWRVTTPTGPSLWGFHTAAPGFIALSPADGTPIYAGQALAPEQASTAEALDLTSPNELEALHHDWAI
ncbi:hypothetical protein [Maritimibacter dapengensis]|uniref:Uncharacterized protein n=1 Tax=Maritimibacter dapengensis TaxID=2836868 RepID=A0ABS6SXX8_9RHOB|nr:hypothetical protein [Maritimibacter dapengensis]MBV7377580.1 hypothetical protein [Maritimibacter dapengensis]